MEGGMTTSQWVYNKIHFDAFGSEYIGDKPLTACVLDGIIIMHSYNLCVVLLHWLRKNIFSMVCIDHLL